ncbi:hypothetical protein TRAPUB_6777 [Trametes pubescens]|uniref:Uncharacterized protein n=1 Tax=Trametes pubescens TaxID=154538 RepID=A0A1M2V563_TRAPU|nr:hypothetical protein TRAPUB_6777 [Trametes pubescens]
MDRGREAFGQDAGKLYVELPRVSPVRRRRADTQLLVWVVGQSRVHGPDYRQCPGPPLGGGWVSKADIQAAGGPRWAPHAPAFAAGSPYLGLDSRARA